MSITSLEPLPFRLAHSEAGGRCLVAVREVRQGEAVVREERALWAPKVAAGGHHSDLLAYHH